MKLSIHQALSINCGSLSIKENIRSGKEIEVCFLPAILPSEVGLLVGHGMGIKMASGMILSECLLSCAVVFVRRSRDDSYNRDESAFKHPATSGSYRGFRCFPLWALINLAEHSCTDAMLLTTFS